MVTILRGTTIEIDWKVVSAFTKQPIDFEGVEARLYLIAPDNKYVIPFEVERDAFRGLKATVSTEGLTTGVYDIKVIWLRDHLCKQHDYRNVSKKCSVFAITDNPMEVNYDESFIKIVTAVESFGRDGMSAYEIATFYGVTDDEWAWGRLNIGDGLELGEGRELKVKTTSQFEFVDGALALSKENGFATTADVDARVAELVGSAPETLDTLGELADAIEDNREVLREYAKKDEIPTKVSQLTNDLGYATRTEIPTKTSQLTNDSGYTSVIPNLLKNTNFGDGFNGWTRSGTVTIKDNVYEGLGVAEIGELAKLAQSVRLTEGRYTLSFRAVGELGRDYPLIVSFVRANIADITTDFYKTNTSVFVTEPRDLVTVSFTVTQESDMDIQFESTRYVYLVDSIRLDEGDTANAYDEYLMQKRLVSGFNISTINGRSLLSGGNITIEGGSGGGVASGVTHCQFGLGAFNEDGQRKVQYTPIDMSSPLGISLYLVADDDVRVCSSQIDSLGNIIITSVDFTLTINPDNGVEQYADYVEAKSDVFAAKDEIPRFNLFKNGDFADGAAGWEYDERCKFSNGEANVGDEGWIKQSVRLIAGATYYLSFSFKDGSLYDDDDVYPRAYFDLGTLRFYTVKSDANDIVSVAPLNGNGVPSTAYEYQRTEDGETFTITIVPSETGEYPITLGNYDGDGYYDGVYYNVSLKKKEFMDMLPTKTSQLTNDSGYITEGRVEEMIEEVETKIVSRTESVATIQPNVLNVWGEVASLDITLAEPTDSTIVNEYMVQFACGATATTLTLPNTIKWMAAPNIQPNKTYQLSVINNLGVIGEFSHE